MNEKIDFVITWVDGADEDWLTSKSKWLPNQDVAGYDNNVNYENASANANTNANTANLYRDWDNLHYWFRGIEKHAPWVNKIHFVTAGHLPSWLNTKHPKVNIVRHTDFIPKEYLPTFNSHAIELNMHRIDGLEEQFVYFNDDMFIINDMHPKDFFANGLPCDSAIMMPLAPLVPKDPLFHYLINNLSVINHNFLKKKIIKSHPDKWFSMAYGKLLLKNLYYAPFGRGFSGFMNCHMPASYLISTFKEVWEREPEMMHATSLNRFRTVMDVNPYVFSYWQFASGKFIPRKTDIGSFNIIGENDEKLLEAIVSKKHKMICLNDSIMKIDFIKEKESIRRCFNLIFPEKSSFEL